MANGPNRNSFEWSNSESRQAYQHVVDRLALREERVLTAIRCLSEGMDKRLGRIEQSRMTLFGRLDSVEERLHQIEKRLSPLRGRANPV